MYYDVAIENVCIFIIVIRRHECLKFESFQNQSSTDEDRMAETS